MRDTRRGFLAVAAAAAVAAPFRSFADGQHPLVARLVRELDGTPNCGERASIQATLLRLRRLALPSSGRLIVVNVAGRFLAAYKDGEPELESRVVVGRDNWRTPDIATSVEAVTLNPTWTVPETILRDERWRERIAEDPDWAESNGFDVLVGGRRLAPAKAGYSDLSKATLVQRPGPDNALGRMKVTLRNSGAIYLHDTNATEGYDDPDRADSHGCVRVELAMELATWILGSDAGEVGTLTEAGRTVVRRDFPSCSVVFGYFTAWPDARDQIVYYTDIYGRDGPGCGSEERRP